MEIWERRCRSLEPSLFKSIIQSEFDQTLNQEEKVYLVTTDRKNLYWMQPEPEFVKKIGQDNILVFDDSTQGTVIYIGGIQWIDRQTVDVSYGLFQADKKSHGVNNARFRLDDGTWSCIERGTQWTSAEGCQ